MDTLFYYPDPDLCNSSQVQLQGQEAKHAARVLRKKVGDTVFLANGLGCKATGEITSVSKQFVSISITDVEEKTSPKIKKVLGLGVIKKRDRFEFAIEKAVELGATTICLFDADHSERTRINKERVDAIVQSAFKQSGRWFLPEVITKESINDVLLHFADHVVVMAHEKKELSANDFRISNNALLLVGPEGGFSDSEVETVSNAGGRVVSLGPHRLRAETAVTAILSQFLFTA
ncbi:MAG: 16S rRNA (uracil(1498)-N(3))-methyltransferase [Balneolaceae bacterium]|nr:16S rRNA (uracil(1498)-N(3))-methyltransferase [Balneolaceae bacterium]